MLKSLKKQLLYQNYSTVTPWYVKEALKTAKNDIKTPLKFPDLPENPPKELDHLVTHAIQDMGLEDVVVIDKRLKETGLGPSIFILGTALSPRHLNSATMTLTEHIKKGFNVTPKLDGILTTNFMKLFLKRMKKRQQKQRQSHGDTTLDRVSSWVVVDTKVSNIYVHLMTADRRKLINLEGLEEDLEDHPIVVPPRTTKEVYVSPAKRHFHTSRIQNHELPLNREELALENLDLERRQDLHLNSFEVTDFEENFPSNPTRLDYKLKLRFFALCAINSPAFCLTKVVDVAEEQQINQFYLDNEDIELVMAAICYYKQSQFKELKLNDETLASFRDLCDLKSELILRFFSFAIEPQNNTILLNNRLLLLLYRTFTCMSCDSTTPVPDFTSKHKLNAFYDVERLTPVRLLLEANGGLQNMQTVGVLLTSLINANLVSPFWKVAEGAILSVPDNTLFIVELALSLAVKSNDKEVIDYAILKFVPEKVMMAKLKLNANIIKLVERGLDVVGEGKEYENVRKGLKAAKTVV